MADPVWLLVMFDLPVQTKQQVNAANGFRHMLIDDGFGRVQLSVYSKYFINSNGTARCVGKLKYNIPAGGAVRILRITDRQWGSTVRIESSKSGEALEKVVEKAPEALLLF